jgi:hypothetical protein
MEERIRLAAKAKEPAAPKEVETAVEQKKEAPPEKAPAAAAAKEGPTRPEVGKFYVIYLKNHRQLTGKVMSKDARGLWLAIDRGAQVYVANFDIKETREQHEGK